MILLFLLLLSTLADVAKGIEIDFYIVRVMAGLVDKYFTMLNTSLVAFVDEFACRVYEELDYTKEGENAVRHSCEILQQEQQRVTITETTMTETVTAHAGRIVIRVVEADVCLPVQVKFKELYGDRPDVVVPAIYWDRTNTRVLTMEWIDGVKLSAQAR